MTNQLAATRSAAAMALALASACLPKLPEPNPGNPDAAVLLCGAKGQACCAAGSAPCGAALRCEVAEGVCVDQETRYCTSDEQCRAGQTCCISGLIGSCSSVAPGAECPQADLVVELSPESLGLAYEVREFDPVASPPDACAIEKGCVGAAGTRQLLHFSAAVRNAGPADLLLGVSSQPPFSVAACDERPYLPHYVDYSLVNADGQTVTQGSVEAPCSVLPDSFSSELDCDFGGLRAGWSHLLPSQPGSGDGCQWLDITGVESGDYVLRVQVNEQARLTEGRLDNNRAAVPIRLPAFDAPTRACPSGPEAALLGTDVGRDCGWRQGAAPRACTPGQGIEVTCSACRGNPMLRVCDGTGSCTGSAALASEAGDSGSCPIAAFPCPASGVYGVYWSPLLASTAGASCRLAPPRNLGL